MSYDASDIERLRKQVAGPVFLADDPGFADEVASFNTTAVHRPRVAVGVLDASDVQATVRWAAEHDLPVAVQATGHGAVVSFTDGVLVSTKRMQELTIDAASRTAVIGAGVKWRAVIDAAVPYGLAPLSGSSSDAGAVGYTLGGGLPLLGRTFGFSSDHAMSFDVVTADGVLRRASAEVEPDLYWALRGGKANMGIVTSMTVELVEAATIYGGSLYYEGVHAPRILEAYRDWADGLSESTTSSFKILRLPPLPEVPEVLQGRVTVQVCIAHVGDPSEGQSIVRSMRDVAPVLMDDVGEMSYADADLIHRDPDHPVPVNEGCVLLSELTDPTMDALMSVAGPDADCPLVMIELRHLGGALARSHRGPDAVGGRDASFFLFFLGVLMGPAAEAVPGALASALAKMGPYGTGRTLVNLHGTPTSDVDRARPWPAEVHGRLLQVKAAYDPHDLFRFGHSLTAERSVSPVQG